MSLANPQSPWKAISLVSVIGMDLAIGTLIGVWLGRKVDNFLGSAPWGTVGGVFLGMALGVFISIPIIKKFLGDQS